MGLLLHRYPGRKRHQRAGLHSPDITDLDLPGPTREQQCTKEAANEHGRLCSKPATYESNLSEARPEHSLTLAPIATPSVSLNRPVQLLLMGPHLDPAFRGQAPADRLEPANCFQRCAQDLEMTGEVTFRPNTRMAILGGLSVVVDKLPLAKVEVGLLRPVGLGLYAPLRLTSSRLQDFDCPFPV